MIANMINCIIAMLLLCKKKNLLATQVQGYLETLNPQTFTDLFSFITSFIKN